MNCRVENDPSSPDAILVLFGGHRKRFIPATPEREAAGELRDALGALVKSLAGVFSSPDKDAIHAALAQSRPVLAKTERRNS